MGNIYKRNSIWYVDLCIKGKRIRKRVGKSKHLAQQALHDIELKAERNQLGFLDQKEITVKDFLDKFFEYSQANHRPQTVARYRSALTNFHNYLNKNTRVNKLSQITPNIIDKFKVHRRNAPVARNGGNVSRVSKKSVSTGAKGYTVNFEITALRTIFNLAKKWNYADSNPASEAKLLKTDDSKARRFLTDIECEWFLEHTPKEHYAVFFTFLNTGMRRAELVNLEWNDINFEAKTLKIQRKPFWRPKTGEREIPMNDELAKLLDRLPKNSNFVFTNNKDKQLNPDHLRGRLVEIAKTAGIKKLTEIHALRHTFATRLIAKGVDLPTVQKLMGHSSIETTMIYTHQTTDHLRNAVSKLTFNSAVRQKTPA